VRLKLEVKIAASSADVWDWLQDIRSHTRWMRDARSIEFLGQQQQGIGARFSCETKVGPIVLNDVMEVIEWTPGHRLGVRHTGLVSGEGTFELSQQADGQVVFVWDEVLRFPWQLGGVVGEAVAKPIMRAIWKGNLKRLKELIEQDKEQGEQG